MNKRLSIVLLCCLLTASVFCQSRVSISGLYNRFANEENVEKVNIGGLLMLAAKPFINKHASGMNVSSVKVMSFDDCSRDVKLRFNEMAERLNDDKYEVLLKSNDKDEKTRILARIQNDVIRELIIVSMGDEPALVSIKGKIRPEDVQKLVNSKNNEQR